MGPTTNDAERDNSRGFKTLTPSVDSIFLFVPKLATVGSFSGLAPPFMKSDGTKVSDRSSKIYVRVNESPGRLNNRVAMQDLGVGKSFKKG